MKILFCLAPLIVLLAACVAPPPEPSPPPSPTAWPAISPFVINPTGGSNVEEAHARLEAAGDKVYLVIVSSDSSGDLGTIYYDLQTRQIRATAGPDEGIDTRSVSCYPDCVFVRREDVDDLSVAGWMAVLRHEYRHVTQARNNPEMAHAFRGADGRFTPYAAFLEACADYGINVKASYHAQERIDALKAALGPGMEGVLGQACQGQAWAFDALLREYQSRGSSFNELFPPYD